MKKKIIFSIVFTIICTGCVNDSSKNNIKNSVITTTILDDFYTCEDNSKSDYSIKNETEIQTRKENNKVQESEIVQTISTEKELILPNITENAKPTVEDIVLPWTEESVEAAWEISPLSTNYSTYFDRCFADIDGDGVNELFLTVSSGSFFITASKLDNGNIVYLDTIQFNDPVWRSRLAIPPTDEETLSASKWIRPENGPYENDMWILKLTVDKRDFRIMQDSKGNSYFSGYGLAAGNALCWVIQLKIQEGKLTGERVYKWGYYQIFIPNFSLQYYKLKDGKWNITTKQEINEFLADLR